jgi:uncharacterized membrane protein YccC
MRALRATIVMPALFALTYKVIGDLQMATFAAFGSFATLVLASFGGTRRDKAIAHLGLALVGSVVLIIGTAVHGTAWLAAIVTIPVAFALFFAGVAGPNAASGVTAALLAYVLPVASPGTIADVPSRLAGWWLASVAGTAAVLLLSPRSPGDRLRAAAAALATALASHLEAAERGEATPAGRDAAVAAKHELMDLFAATPYRPTGLATADQGLANITEVLEWVTSLTADALGGHVDVRQAAPADRELLGAAARVLANVAFLLSDQDVSTEDIARDIGRLERARDASSASQHKLSGDAASVRAAAEHAVHAQAIAVAARSAVADAMIATRRADPETIAAQRRTWYGQNQGGALAGGRLAGGRLAGGRLAGLAAAASFAERHASIRSALFRSSARGAVALAAAVAIADITDVQHGFWVVLGTLSVLRTNAASTGSTVLRALAGTVLGVAVGAALVLAIGTGPYALWIALPVAVLVAAYAPGTAPFAVGQAAFTVTVIVLFNLLVPTGWKVGLVRVQDVLIGCAVSLVVGVLFWPRGASSTVGDDLADAFRCGAAYLTQAVDWSLGLRQEAPDTAVAAVAASIRLDDALRLFLTEQGTKRASKHDLWSLVMATIRLRLTANSLAGLRAHCPPLGADGHPDPVRALRRLAADLAEFYQRIAVRVGPPGHDELVPLAVPALLAATGSDGAGGLDGAAAPDGAGGADAGGLDGAGGAGTGGPDGAGAPDGAGTGGPDGMDGAESSEAALVQHRPHAVWVREHLRELGSHAHDIIAPAEHVAQLRRVPWWR